MSTANSLFPHGTAPTIVGGEVLEPLNRRKGNLEDNTR